MLIRAMILGCLALSMVTSETVAAADKIKMSWPDWLLESGKSCNKSGGLSEHQYGALVGEGRTLEAADAIFSKILQDKIRAQQACLTEMKPSAPTEYRGGIETAIAATSADLNAVAAPSRAKFLTNPAGYTMIGQTDLQRYADYEPKKLTAALGIYANLKTLEQACGRYEFATPPNERTAIERAWNAAQPYLQCVDGYHKNSPPFPGYFGGTLGKVAEHLRGYAHFVCSKWRSQGCVDDEKWQVFAAIATPENVALAKKGSSAWDTEKRNVEFVVSQYSDWAEDIQFMWNGLNQKK